MNNITLGKVLKAMYKLSGKTLTQLSEETNLTVDTINNLFYARVQKPGLIGVNALVNAMGFSIQQLMSFLEAHPNFSDKDDVTELFTAYLDEAGASNVPVSPSKGSIKETKGKTISEMERLKEEHDKQLDLFRTTYLQHTEQLQLQYNRQIDQM